MMKSLSDGLVGLLAAADKRNNLPAGTMFSVMQQEVGGNADKYIQDPSAYHYGLNAEGKRIAGHTGKVSTAFGPFGILESTAAQPGYGVTPLKDKSIDEQIRFASDYLAARSKSAGSLQDGLASYGEGAKYAQQVAARTGSAPAQPVPVDFPQSIANAVAPEPIPVPVSVPVPTPQVQVENPMAALEQAMPPTKATVANLSFGNQIPVQDIQPIAFNTPRIPQISPDFGKSNTRNSKWKTVV